MSSGRSLMTNHKKEVSLKGKYNQSVREELMKCRRPRGDNRHALNLWWWSRCERNKKEKIDDQLVTAGVRFISLLTLIDKKKFYSISPPKKKKKEKNLLKKKMMDDCGMCLPHPLGNILYDNFFSFFLKKVFFFKMRKSKRVTKIVLTFH